MRRREAIQLFREICQCTPDAFISSISLSPNATSKKEFELRINMALDGKNLKNVENIVNKHGLVLKELKGALLIYGVEPKLNEVAIPLNIT